MSLQSDFVGAFKSGVKTSEFWMTVLWILGGLIVAAIAAGLAGSQGDSLAGALIVCTQIAVSGFVLSRYTSSRGAVKAAQNNAPAVRPSLPVNDLRVLQAIRNAKQSANPTASTSPPNPANN